MKTHGMSKTPIYKIWKGIVRRCTKQNCSGWQYYGGRGITVCDRWRDSFENFFEDMGERPKGKEIDRIDNNGGYSKENCRWATKSENTKNRRKIPAPMIGSEHYETTFTDDIVNSIRAEYAIGNISYSQLCARYGVTPSTMQDLVKGRTWKHLPVLPSPPPKKYQKRPNEGKMINWNLPIVTLDEVKNPAALRQKYIEEWQEYITEKPGSMESLLELWDVLQVCITWAANGGGIDAVEAYHSARRAMEKYHTLGLPVRDAKERMLVKNATRPRPGGGTGYYSPEVCAEIMAGTWGEK